MIKEYSSPSFHAQTSLTRFKMEWWLLDQMTFGARRHGGARVEVDRGKGGKNVKFLGLGQGC